MTRNEIRQIEMLRQQGMGYKKIAAVVGASPNTVKSYLRRNDVQGEPEPESGRCKNCGRPLTMTRGKRKKTFCSDKCRMEWWNTHPEAVSRKAFYAFTCAACGSTFESYGNAGRKYCSRACAAVGRRRGKAGDG